MKIAVAADHGGFLLKQDVVKLLQKWGHEVVDLGAHEYDALDDYPDFALAAARSVAQKEVERAVVLCGSGVGACIAANKIKGVRACVCHDSYSARQGVLHDDMNLLCLGSRIIGVALLEDLLLGFVEAEFTAEERHARRGTSPPEGILASNLSKQVLGPGRGHRLSEIVPTSCPVHPAQVITLPANQP